jgi:hypothetical protein
MTGIREVFRYAKAHRTRTYGLKPLDDDRAELWVATAERGRPMRSRRLTVLTGHEETAIVLESVEQELRLGGWRSITG